jgi:GT2 family glycosyltransferase
LYFNDNTKIFLVDSLNKSKIMLKKYALHIIRYIARYLRAAYLSLGLSKHKSFEQSNEEILASHYFSIIVPIHDSAKVTNRCLKSIEKFSGKAEIILVDDGSKLSETVEIINKYSQKNHWCLIRHKKAKGHSRACEKGAEKASRRYICLLNSDTVLTHKVWNGIKDAFESDDMIAVVGPTTSWAPRSPQMVWKAEKCRYYWNNKQICAFAENYIASRRKLDLIDLAKIAGFAFFIRKEIWKYFGGFDNKLSDYGNEYELCTRIKKEGYRIIWTKNSYIHHLGEESYKKFGLEEISKRRRKGQSYIDKLHRL